jgi:hypothetical protein
LARKASGGETRGRPSMAHGGRAKPAARNVCAQKERLGFFIAVDNDLARTKTTVVSAWGATRPRYGGDATGRAARVGATPPVRAWRVAPGDRAGMAVRQCGPTAHGPADQGRPRRAGPAGPRRNPRDAGATARSGRPGTKKPFRLASLDRVFL